MAFNSAKDSAAGLPTRPGSAVRPVRSFTGGSESPRMADTLASMGSALNQIYRLSDRNSGRSEAQASELRDWQVQQNATAMQFNSAEAAKNREWQQMMSNTAHQREVADLRAAGLNPVLSAGGGQGAAVTSGATASGVTSAGAKGETDMSTTQALVSLLGTMWAAQTQVEMQRASAENNLAIADKNASASQAVARIYGEYGLQQAGLSAESAQEVARISGEYHLTGIELSGDTSRDIARIQAENNKELAHISGAYGIDMAKINQVTSQTVASINAGAARYSADASRYAADVHAAASQYAADAGLSGTKLRVVADTTTALITNKRTTNATKYAADTSAAASMYGTDVGSETSRRGQNMNLLGDIAKSIGIGFSSVPKTSGKFVAGFGR